MTTFASNTLALGPDFISADNLAKAGLAVVLLIVFAESGLLVGFFLPGDSLLFTMGLLISRDEVSTPLWLACVLIGLAAIAGDQVGYLFGRKVGPALFRRPDSKLFKQEYVDQAHEFFEKYGPRSIVLARFVPIVRTFTPVIAGVSRMNYRVFVMFNVIGGVLWGCGVTILGFFLGKIDFVRENVEAMLILIVLISVVPIIIEFLRSRRKKAAAGPGPAHGGSDGSGSSGGPGSGGPGPEYDGPVPSGGPAGVLAGGYPGGQYTSGRNADGRNVPGTAGGDHADGGYVGGPGSAYGAGAGDPYLSGARDAGPAGPYGAPGGHPGAADPGRDADGYQRGGPADGHGSGRDRAPGYGRGGRHSASRHR